MTNDTTTNSTHYNLVCNVFELTRDIFGYKPSWTHLDSMTDSELETENKFLSDYIRLERENEMADERAHEAATARALTVHSGFSIGELVSL